MPKSCSRSGSLPGNVCSHKGGLWCVGVAPSCSVPACFDPGKEGMQASWLIRASSSVGCARVKKAYLTRSLPWHSYGVPRRRTIFSQGADVFALAPRTLSEWQKAQEEVSHGESGTCTQRTGGPGDGCQQWTGASHGSCARTSRCRCGPACTQCR